MLPSFWPTPLLRPALLSLVLAVPLVPALAADPAKAPDAPAPAAEAPPPNPVIAKVNATELHLSDFMMAFGQRARQIQSQDQYQQMLKSLIDVHLIADAGNAQHLGDDPDVKAKLAALQKQVVAQAYIDKLQQKSASDEATKAKYDDMVAKKTAPEEVKARHILLKTEAEAKSVIAQLDKGADFAKLANEKSTDPTVKAGSSVGGELGWFTRDKMVAEFSEAAFKLKAGEYTKTPVHSQFGYHVIQTEEKRVQPFEDAKAAVQTELAKTAIDTAIKDLETKAKIEKFGPDGKPMEDHPDAAPPPASPAPDAKAPADAKPAPAPKPKP